MVFCVENEDRRRPLRSTMVHFQASEVQQLLHNKFVVILGDSIQRAVYKDLVLLLQKDSLLTAAQLKAKGELSFEQDQLVAGGQLGELHNGTQYREVRQFCSGSGHHLVRFYFLTRVYSEYLEGVLEELTYGPTPDLVIINSCLWDLSRYGRFSMESYRENLERVFVRMDQVLPDSCLLVWNMAMPLGERVTGGFLLPELQPLAGSLRRDVVEGNFYSATLAGDHCFDVLDLHFHFRHAVRHRHRDGVHWDQHAHRHLSHLLLTHVADAWGVELPKRDYPPDSWIEDWPEPDHLLQGNHGQPPDFGEQLPLPPPCPSPLPPPMPFPFSLPQPSLPPLFPPLSQDAPFFPGQPFPPHEFLNYNPVEDFSVPPHLGCGPGANFVPGPLPPPVPGPVPPWSPPGPRGPSGDATLCTQWPLPCAEDGGALQAATQTLRQTDPHIQTGQTASCPFGDMTWVGWILGWGWMCQWSRRACLPSLIGPGYLLCAVLFLSIAITNKGMEEQSGIFLCEGASLPNYDLKSWGGSTL